jgi:hypothetical protein
MFNFFIKRLSAVIMLILFLTLISYSQDKKNSISGFAQSSSAEPESDVTIMISKMGSNGEFDTSTVYMWTKTDDKGFYKFTDVPSGGNYIVYASKPDYKITPAYKILKNLNENAEVNFSCTKIVIFSISGYITNNNSEGLDEVILDLKNSTGVIIVSVQTDSKGYYKVNYIKTAGSFSLIPAKSGYKFDPEKITFENPEKEINQNFKGSSSQVRYKINGKLMDASSNPIENALVSISIQNKSGLFEYYTGVQTNSDGYFEFKGLSENLKYIVTPVKQNYRFAPESITIESLNANTTADFTGQKLITHRISGYVTDKDSKGLVGARMVVGGTNNIEAYSDSNGYYSFNFEEGKLNTIIPTRKGYTFEPNSIVIQDLKTDKVQNFIASKTDQQALSISGCILLPGTGGVQNVSVALSGAKDEKTTTDKNGFYKFSDLTEGRTYRISLNSSEYSLVNNDTSISGIRDNVVVNLLIAKKILGVDNLNNSIPDRIDLFQNYPNPFNPSTMIKFQLAKSSNVKIQVYNSLGSLVKTLFDGKKEAGVHEINFEAKGLCSGVYFVRMYSNNELKMMKINLLK